LLLQTFGNQIKRFDQEGPGSAAGIEDIDARVSKTVSDAEFLAQRRIDAVDHVANDFGRRIPNAEILPQRRVEGCQERLIEILDSELVIERRKERGAIDAIERGTCPAENLDKTKRAETARRRHLFEQIADHGDMQ
jgi:hypothetical protein